MGEQAFLLGLKFSEHLKICGRTLPLDTGRKFNVYKAFRTRPGRIMSVQFAPCAQGFGFTIFLKL